MVGMQTMMQMTSVEQSICDVPTPAQYAGAEVQTSGVLLRGSNPLVVPLVPTCAVEGSLNGAAYG